MPTTNLRWPRKGGRPAKILSPAKLAVRWGIHIGTLANWRTRGIGPVYRKGRIIRGRLIDGQARTCKVFYALDAIKRWGKAHGYET